MDGVTVGRRVDRNGLDAELVQRTDHPHGDLAPVRDEDAAEHVRQTAGGPATGSISNRSVSYSTGCALST